MALCPLTLDGEYYRYANARPGKLGIGTMAVDSMDGRRRGKRGEGEEPVSKHQIQPGCGKSVSWRGTRRPNLSHEKINFSSVDEDRENKVFN